MRPDPHLGKYPEAPVPIVEPGTPEHTAWLAEQAGKRAAAEARFIARGREIARPRYWADEDIG